MTSRILLFVCLICYTTTIVAQNSDVIWACKVTQTNDTLGWNNEPWYKPKQALYISDTYPTKKKANGRSYIMGYGSKESDVDITFEFCSPAVAKKIAIVEPWGAGAITYVEVIDVKGKKEILFQNKPDTLYGRSRIWYLPVTNKNEIKSIHLKGKPSFDTYWNCIDAIALMKSDVPLNLELNLYKDLHLMESCKPFGREINSEVHDIIPVISPDGKELYINRENHPGNCKNKSGSYNNQDIWYTSKDEQGNWRNAIHFEKPLNNSGHNFVSSITADNNTLFLANRYTADGEPNGEGASVSHRIKGGGWSVPKNIIIEDFKNDFQFVSFFLHPSKKYLFMSIQDENSVGESDLYISFPKGCDLEYWTKPINLGPKINTMLEETTPFLSADERTMYFSSEGYLGYGGMDLFMTRRVGEGWDNWTTPLNLGPMVNTTSDDMGFSLPASGDILYTYTWVDGMMGDIVSTRIDKNEAIRPYPIHLLKGKVYDVKTGKIISAEIIYEILPDGKHGGCATSDPDDGTYAVALPSGEHYAIHANAKGYYAIHENIDISDDAKYNEVLHDIKMVPLEIGATIQLKNVFFVQSKPELLSSSFPELNRLAQILKDNPSLEIRIDGHTDNQGDDQLNMKLSQDRVVVVKNYLIQKGIKAARLTVQAFGETKPIASNDKEETRKLNRRVEFTVMKN